MTEAQAKWLRKLRDEGPQTRRHYDGGTSFRLFHNGWLEWADDLPNGDQITPAGLAALAEHEAAKAKPAAEEGK